MGVWGGARRKLRVSFSAESANNTSETDRRKSFFFLNVVKKKNWETGRTRQKQEHSKRQNMYTDLSKSGRHDAPFFYIGSNIKKNVHHADLIWKCRFTNSAVWNVIVSEGVRPVSSFFILSTLKRKHVFRLSVSGVLLADSAEKEARYLEIAFETDFQSYDNIFVIVHFNFSDCFILSCSFLIHLDIFISIYTFMYIYILHFQHFHF